MRLSGRLSIALLLTSAIGWGCNEECTDAPPGFKLRVSGGTVDSARALSLTVELETPDSRRRDAFNVEDSFGDAQTSLVVQLDPPPEESIAVDVTVRAFDARDGTGNELGRASSTLQLGPNGCNELSLTLATPIETPDAGFVDAGAPQSCSPDGSSCSDQNACTINDLCIGGLCGGVISRDSTCSATCNGAPSCRSTSPCCAGSCNGNNCPDECPLAGSCDIVCNDPDCGLTCRTGSHCRLEAVSDTGQTSAGLMTCEDGASCELSCNAQGDGASNCTLECQSGAHCLLSDCTAIEPTSVCLLDCQGDAAQSCPGGEMVCRRPCP